MFSLFFWSFISGAAGAVLLEAKREIDHAQKQQAWAAERERLQEEFTRVYLSNRESA